jgi:hypothetical protein
MGPIIALGEGEGMPQSVLGTGASREETSQFTGSRLLGEPKDTDLRPRTDRSAHRPEAAEGNGVLLSRQRVRVGVEVMKYPALRAGPILA